MFTDADNAMDDPASGEPTPHQPGSPAGGSSADRRPATERLQQLEARIRAFHERLAELDRAEGHAQSPLTQADEIVEQAHRQAEEIRSRAVAEATEQAQQLWQSLEAEAQAIQDEVSLRVDRLTAQMKLRSTAAEQEARLAREQLTQQIREAAAAAIERVNRADGPPLNLRSEAEPPAGTDSIEDVLSNLGAAALLIGRSVAGLVALLRHRIGGDDPKAGGD